MYELSEDIPAFAGVNGAQAVSVQRKPKLVVVEDDDEFRESILLPRLAGQGYEVDGMSSALQLYRAMTTRRYDLVLLDAGLPDESGFSIAAHLRKLSPSLGIVMLSAYASARDQMRGLKAGVDVYLTKPLDFGLLSVALGNLARRVQLAGVDAPSPEGWHLDRGNWRIRCPNGVEVVMSLSERQVIESLAAAPGVPVRRESLIARLAENVHDFDPHRLEMLVYRLRKRCLKLSGYKLPIHAVRGVGYVLTW